MDQPTSVYEDSLIRQLMSREIAGTPGGQSEWAKTHGFSGTFVSDVLRGKAGVSDRLARVMGFYKMTFYVPLAALEEPLPAPVEPEQEGRVASEFLAAFIESEV